MLERLWRNRKTVALLVGMQTDTVTTEVGMEIALKYRTRCTHVPPLLNMADNPACLPWAPAADGSHQRRGAGAPLLVSLVTTEPTLLRSFRSEQRLLLSCTGEGVGLALHFSLPATPQPSPR